MPFVSGIGRRVCLPNELMNVEEDGNGSLEIMDVSQLSLPIIQCTVYFNKVNGPLVVDVRLGSQISVVNLTEQDITEFVSTSPEGADQEVFENQAVNSVTIMRSYLHSTLNPLIGTFKKDGGGTRYRHSCL